MTPAAGLRARLATGPILVAPGAPDALTARIVERTGFEAVYFTGAGFAYTHLGAPDLGLVTLTETAWRVGTIVEATALPVIVDADDGYGGPFNVRRTVRLLEAAGAAAVQLEDQVAPKRCGHLAGQRVVPPDVMVGKLKAAVDARRDPALVVIARTDARAVEGLDAALERAHRYREAGADLLFVEAPRTREELARIARELPPPVMANMVEGGRTPLLSAPELDALGFRLVIFPGAAVRAAALVVTRLMERLRQDGSTAAMVDAMLSFDQLNALLDLPHFQEQERRYVLEEA
ncbi:MAG: oxaloacetate decarboxylase [Armatimonadota bacterium]|nr:oxaloacetate decarboxylase [Armatimonadota bacterium]MDR7449835.1 oxaloacetate decarboxylase [Armatimonadota bacterium]MDR7460086.1 oxaloacetate decarboxylase [Armatimonadota bacterium]MDR7480634.1 oxaloacetate decarboxylase [Armatimonadota bacterium]MDR7488376.1 oxaloacetate decarboxylase [Armatimonadota bacterium]